MAMLPIRIYPDPVLREPTKPVDDVDDSVRKLIRDMLETMYAAPGVGLAAPQVGVQRRVLVYDVAEEPIALVNPKITYSSGEVTDEEGCLSIPGLAYPVARAQLVRVEALGTDGRPVLHEVEDLEARVVQHEIDHLDGVLYLDRLDRELRKDALRTLRERALQGSPTPVPHTPSSRL